MQNVLQDTWMRLFLTMLFLPYIRFRKDVEHMTGNQPGWYWVITWRYLGPVLGLLLFIAGLYDIGDKGLGYTKWIREKVRTRNAFIFQFL